MAFFNPKLRTSAFTIAHSNAQADKQCKAGRYERSPDQVDTRAGSYERKLETLPARPESRVRPSVGISTSLRTRSSVDSCRAIVIDPSAERSGPPSSTLPMSV